MSTHLVIHWRASVSCIASCPLSLAPCLQLTDSSHAVRSHVAARHWLPAILLPSHLLPQVLEATGTQDPQLAVFRIARASLDVLPSLFALEASVKWGSFSGGSVAVASTVAVLVSPRFALSFVLRWSLLGHAIVISPPSLAAQSAIMERGSRASLAPFPLSLFPTSSLCSLPSLLFSPLPSPLPPIPRSPPPQMTKLRELQAGEVAMGVPGSDAPQLDEANLRDLLRRLLSLQPPASPAIRTPLCIALLQALHYCRSPEAAPPVPDAAAQSRGVRSAEQADRAVAAEVSASSVALVSHLRESVFAPDPRLRAAALHVAGAAAAADASGAVREELFRREVPRAILRSVAAETPGGLASAAPAELWAVEAQLALLQMLAGVGRDLAGQRGAARQLFQQAALRHLGNCRACDLRPEPLPAPGTVSDAKALAMPLRDRSHRVVTPILRLAVSIAAALPEVRSPCALAHSLRGFLMPWLHLQFLCLTAPLVPGSMAPCSCIIRPSCSLDSRFSVAIGSPHCSHSPTPLPPTERRRRGRHQAVRQRARRNTRPHH